MADYKIDVKASLNLTQYRNEIKKQLLSNTYTVKLTPKIIFNGGSNIFDSTTTGIDALQGKIQKWFSDPQNAIALNFTYAPDQQLQKQLESIRSAIKTVAPINIPVNADIKKIQSLATELKKIGDAYTKIDNEKAISIGISDKDTEALKQQTLIIKEVLKELDKSINISFNPEDLAKLQNDITNTQNQLNELSNTEIKFSQETLEKIKNPFDEKTPLILEEPTSDNLNEIKGKIEQYFKDNPIVLTLSQNTEGIDWTSLNQKFETFYSEQNETVKKFLQEQTEIAKIEKEKELEEAKQATIKYQEEQKRETIKYQEDLKRETQILAEDRKKQLEQEKQEKKEAKEFGLEITKEFLEEEKQEKQRAREFGAEMTRELLEEERKEKEESAEFFKEVDSEILQEQEEANQKRIEQIKQREQQEQEAAEKTLQVWKDSIDRAVQDFENNQDLTKFNSALESIKMFSEQAGVDLQQYLNKAFEIRDEYINKSVKQTEEMYERESSGFKNITEEIKNGYIEQQSSITQSQIEYSETRLRIQQEEAEKEQNILQEEAHTRSEIISSMFDDYNDIINIGSKALQEVDKEFEEKTNFSKYYQQETEKITRILNKAFTEDVTNILRHYRRNTEDFEAYNTDFWKRVGLAVQQGVSDDIIQKSQDHWNRIAIQHENYVKKIEEQEEKARQKKAQEDEKEVQQVVKNQTAIYNSIVNNLKQAYDVGSLTFEQFQKKMLETMTDARNLQIVPDDLIDKTSLQLEKITKHYEDKQKALEEQQQKSLQKQEEQQQKALEKQRQEEIKSYEKSVKENQKYQENLVKQQTKYNQDLSKAKEQQWNNDAKNLQERYNKEIISTEEYVSRMQALLPEAFDNGYKNAQHYANILEEVQKEQNETAESSQKLSGNFDNVFNSLVKYFGVTQIFSAVSSSFSKMVQEVRDLDVEMTEFSKVTDLTEQQTEKFIEDSYELGESVARTGTEVVQATTLFKKMGHTVDESMDLAKDALTWTNVADGMVSVEEASNMLISTMKAFEKQGLSSTHVIDALNEVSNKYSTSSSALSNNLSTVAATLAVSGTSFEQTLGLMTAGIEIMPDKASKVANGLKTISQRIRQIDGDTADKLDEFLGSKGISRYDEVTGQLKGTYDILEEISGKWEEWSENEQQYIGEVMAGKNQITVLNALMMNFSTAINATETAINSAGSAYKELQRVLNSIQGHINNFTSAFKKLSKDLISSNLMKNVIDLGTIILKIIDAIVSSKVGSSALYGFLTMILASNTTRILGSVEKSIIKIISGFAGLNTNAINSLSELAYAIGTGHKTGAWGGFAEAFISLPSAIGLIVTALGVAKQIIDESNEKVEEARELLQKADDEKISSINEQIKKYEELQSSYDLENLSNEEQITLLREILELNDGNLRVHGDINEEIRQEIEGLLTEKALIASMQEQRAKDNIEFDSGNLGIKDRTRTAMNLNESISDIVFSKSGAKNYTDLLNLDSISINIKEATLQAILDALKEVPQETRGMDWLNIYNTVSSDLNAIRGSIDEVNQYAKESVDSMLQAFDVDIKEMSDEELESMLKHIRIYQDVIAETPEIAGENIDEINDKIDEITGVEHNAVLDVIVDKEQLEVLENELNNEVIARAESGSNELAKSLDKVAKSAEGTGTSLSGALAILGNYSDNMAILTQAQDDMSNSGQITAETLLKIANAGLESYLVLDDENNIIGVNIDALEADNRALEQNAIDEYIASQETSLLAEVKGILSGKLDSSTGSLESEKSALGENITKTQEATDAAIEYAAALYAQAEAGGATSNQLEQIAQAVENYTTRIKNGISTIHSYYNSVSSSSTATSRGASSSSRSSDSSSSRSSTSTSDREAERAAQQAQREAEQAAKDALNAWKDAFNIEYKKLKTYLDAELITNEEYYDALEELNKAFFEGRAEFEEEYWKYQDEIIKGRKKYLEDELKDYFTKGEKILKHQLNVEYITEEEYYDALTLLYETYYTDKEKYEEEYWKLEEEIYNLRKKQIKELEDELKDIYKEIEELHKEYVDSLKEDAEDIKDVVSYATDIIDEEIAKLKAEKEAIDEANESLERQLKLQELEENLEKAKQKKIRVYRKGQGFVYEQDTKAVGEAQTALDEYKKELQHKKQLSMIDEEIAKWEQYKKEWKSVTDSYKISQGEMTAQAMLGESAREKILARESQVVEIVSSKYEEVQGRIETANNATIENLEAYIGDETTAGTFSYEIQRIKDKIDEIQSKTITLQVQTSTSGSNIQGVIDQISTLKEKLEQSYSTNNIDSWSSHYIEQINAIAQASANAGVTLPGSSGSGSYNGGTSGSSGGFNVGDWVTIPDSDIQYEPFKGKRFKIVQFENSGQTAALLVEGGEEGKITYRVPVSHLNATNSGSSSSGNSEPVTEVGRDPVYSTNSQGQQTLAGYNIRYSDGSTIYMPAYASGTLGTASKTFRVNEEGMEAIVTPEGTVVSAPTTGYGVIKNEYTERLTDFASDPMAFLNKEFSGYSGTYKNNTSNNETININGDLSLPNVTDGESFVDSIRNVALQYTTRRR